MKKAPDVNPLQLRQLQARVAALRADPRAVRALYGDRPDACFDGYLLGTNLWLAGDRAGARKWLGARLEGSCGRTGLSRYTEANATLLLAIHYAERDPGEAAKLLASFDALLPDPDASSPIAIRRAEAEALLE